MPAPVSIAHVHVHALRLASDAEALVARVLTVDGVAGFGFSFGGEAFPARDMAAWDAAARSRKVPLYALFGKKRRDRIAIVQGSGISPFDRLLQDVRSNATEKTDLLAPNAHKWELSYCAALAAALDGDVRVAVPNRLGFDSMPVSDAPGIAVDWTLEPAFAAIRWHDPQK
jgi:hypothetical protein